MKKLFILTSVLAAGAISALAQGQVSAVMPASVRITIQDTTGAINGGAITTIGTAAATAGFVGAGPNQVLVTFYAAASGTSLSSLESAQSLVFTATNSPSGLGNAQGSINAGTETLPIATVFNGNSQIEIIAYAQTLLGAGTFGGWSAEATGITPTLPGTGITPAIFGTGAGLINTFALSNLAPVPEPSTIALGGLGAAALLLFRRRK